MIKRIAVVAGFLALGTAFSGAAAEKYSFDQIVHMSCVEAWAAADAKTANVVKMIEILADHTLAARQLSFPDTEEAGRQLGDYIEARCEENPHDLLYNEVDKGVRQVVLGKIGS
jgi:hypothetical protein